ncbi:4Fe-4S binding protein [Methanolobus sp.]|uniref:4Fe-4S binding protein n=1 Tax=Methanolobus sp. TaxID=1874737 RepID=UPI0025EF675F|nr:4Fe-4S binding protein [Methanolobus sp.]
MSELVFGVKDDKQLVYIPEKCIGCGTCVMACPKGSLVIGSVGAVARGLIDKDFLENRSELCILCGICAKTCPTGALELRQAGKAVNDNSYISVALKETTVDEEKCVHCGHCEQICPQACIEVKQWLADDGSARVEGETQIDNECCIHCGWCMEVCPVDAITVEKPFEGTWHRDEATCTACRTCVDTCPCNALFNPEWESGERVDKVAQRPDVCIYCGACDVACPVNAITVTKTAIVPEVEKKALLEKKLLNKEAPRPTLTSELVTDEEACLGCGNCVIVCPVNATDADVGAGYLNEVDSKKLLEIRNGVVNVVDQELCGSCGACAMICPVDAIKLVVREL